jgi:hypothetical protein
MTPQTLHLRDRRVFVANLYDLGANALAAIGVLGAVARSLPVSTPGGILLALAEALAGGALLVAIVGELREIRAGVDDDEGRIAWVTLFAGVVLAAECLHVYLERGRVPRAAGITAVITLGLAIFQPRLKARRLERRSVRVSDEGIVIRVSRFRRFSAAWSEITGLRRDGATLHVELAGGRSHTLRLRAFTNRDEAFTLLAEHAAGHGVRLLGA